MHAQNGRERKGKKRLSIDDKSVRWEYTKTYGENRTNKGYEETESVILGFADEMENIMGIYFVDYENVGDQGLAGARSLTEKDRIIVFYNDRIKSIAFDAYIEMTETRAKVEHIKIVKTGKNYLDFQLITYLGFLLGKGEKDFVYLITKDKGFDSVVDFWKGRNVNICRRECIKGDKGKSETTKQNRTKPALSESWRKKIRTAVKEEHLMPRDYTKIYNLMLSVENKEELHNQLAKIFAPDKSAKVYGAVKPVFEEYLKK